MIREIDISADEKQINFREFNIQTHCIVDLFLRNLDPIKIDKFVKISISLFNYEPQRSQIRADDVLLINLQEDLSYFWTLSNDDRKHWILKKVVDTLYLLSKTYQFDTGCISRAYRDCLAQNIRNEYIHGEIQFEKSKGRFALIFCRHSSDRFEIFAHVYNEAGVKIGVKKLAESRPIWAAYLPFLGKVSKSKEGIVLTTADRKTKFTCDFTYEGTDDTFN